MKRIKYGVSFRELLGLVVIIAGILFGVYVGVWVMFIGGIVLLIETIKGDLSAIIIACGIAKIMFASLVGYIIIVVSILTGKILMD